MVQFSMYYCVADMKCNPHYVFIRFIYLFFYESKVFVTWSVEKTGFQLVVDSAILLVAYILSRGFSFQVFFLVALHSPLSLNGFLT